MKAKEDAEEARKEADEATGKDDRPPT